MMKIFISRMIFILIVVIGRLSGASTSEPVSFLSYDQYLNLPSEQQTKYLKDLQGFVVGLAKFEGFFAWQDFSEEMKDEKYFSMWAVLVPMALAEIDNTDAICKLSSLRKVSMEALASAATQTGWCTDISINGSKQWFRPQAADRLLVIAEEIDYRIKQGKFKTTDKMAAEAAGELSGWIRQFQERPPQRPYNHEAFKKAQELDKKIDALWDEKKEKRPSSKTLMQQAKSNVNIKAVPNRGASPSGLFYRCLNAGFVIPVNAENTCRPYRKLPKELELEGIDRETFLCASKNEIICNPVLFGYEASCKDEKSKECKNAKPLCIPPSQQATKECFDLAKSRGTLERVKLLLAGKNGRETYQNFMKSLHMLCDPLQLERNTALEKIAEPRKERVKKDIQATCKVSYEVMAESVSKNYLPKDLGPVSAPASKIDPKTTK